MERQKGDLLLSWQKKPVGVYLGDYSYYNLKALKVCFFGQSIIRKRTFEALFYTEDSLRFANLTCAHLRNADLRNADLRSANLTYADLKGANLKFIIYDKNTFWPYGFKVSILRA